MNKILFVCSILISSLMQYGCSISISQIPNATSTPQIETNTPTPSAQLSTPAPHGQIGNLSLPNTAIPVTWSDLNLSGVLVYTNSVQSQDSLIFSIQALALASGNITTIFQAPNNAWLDFVSVAPDEKQLVMSYMPPRDDPSTPYPGQQLLFTMPLDGSQPPQLLFPPPGSGDQYYQPVWSPDGKYIYFSHADLNAPPKEQGQHYPDYEVLRMAYPGGQPEKIADQAFWPRLSDDGARLAYVTLNPMDGTNQLFVANPDGSGARQVALNGQYVPPIIDAPFFPPGDQLILYSAVTPTQSSKPNWLERILGILVASAHTVPSDWWSVPIGGGTPTQITHIAAVGLYASLSPDKTHIVSYSGDGLFLMNQDGTGLTILVGNSGGLAGTVSWIP
jgi:Tol biopolymer transport system component